MPSTVYGEGTSPLTIPPDCRPDTVPEPQLSAKEMDTADFAEALLEKWSEALILAQLQKKLHMNSRLSVVNSFFPISTEHHLGIRFALWPLLPAILRGAPFFSQLCHFLAPSPEERWPLEGKCSYLKGDHESPGSRQQRAPGNSRPECCCSGPGRSGIRPLSVGGWRLSAAASRPQRPEAEAAQEQSNSWSRGEAARLPSPSENP